VSAIKGGAMAVAIGVTFAIVWALSSYGYPSTERGSPAIVAKDARARTCL
jgi:hypothetical protein